MRKKILVLACIVALSLVAGCSGSGALKEELTQKDAEIRQLKEEKMVLESRITELQEQVDSLEPSSNPLLQTAIEVMELIKERDLAALASRVHPDKGVRFSPYTFVETNKDLRFSPSEIPGLLQSSQIHTWGAYDGSGNPIELTFSDYYDRFVYDQDFANPHLIGNNVPVGTGNTINNISEAYPDGRFVEFHFTGIDPRYEGMDWRSLSLVFEEKDDTWYLVGIVHNEWTI